ncbi:MAG TPA: endonuclease/exonuclease/phosphatase, partial [Treponema sp.]|nr:endonuclease/exonuclease/phosphatase [Treponema sp.]
MVNLHLDAYESSGGREAQTQMLLDFLYREYAKGNYCIAGGDFNQSFP